MKLTFQDKQVLRNITLSNPLLSDNEIIASLTSIFTLTKDQKEYIRLVKRINN